MFVRDERIVQYAANRVRRALHRTHVAVTPRVYRHLVGVVCLPVRDAWFATQAVHEPLTVWFRRGLAQQTGSIERAMLLGRVGDAALLISGFWWEQHETVRCETDIGFYISLGQEAYQNIDEDPYREMAGKYTKLTDAMAVLASHYTADRNQRVVALCEVWRRRHDARTARILDYLDLPAGFADPGIPS